PRPPGPWRPRGPALRAMPRLQPTPRQSRPPARSPPQPPPSAPWSEPARTPWRPGPQGDGHTPSRSRWTRRSPHKPRPPTLLPYRPTLPRRAVRRGSKLAPCLRSPWKEKTPPATKKVKKISKHASSRTTIYFSAATDPCGARGMDGDHRRVSLGG